ncbi:MAG: hypothetical protein QOG01_4328 [Pseudonocardiales bacterium]|nr:hypothetical protein [Pseudonocardiales bacterium]
MTRIEPMTTGDWPLVREIYAAGIAGGDATFETAPPDWPRFDASRLPQHRFVARGEGGRAVGWVAVSATSNRAVYAGVVEHSVYVDPAYAGRGIGRALLAALIDSTEAAGIWTIESGVFPENVASLVLHERLGFRRIGVRERIGRHGGVWRDVILIERRSPVVG